MKWWIVTIVAAVILLLLADFLAFHDLFESHTVRDWMMLLATALVVVGFIGVIARERRVSAG
jgi:protein-S-isoprenylcysteine O-methyltransferase Ste14